MGASGSKPEKDEALRLCKIRMRLIKQAVDSRYALSAAHLAYIQSLRDVGCHLRRFAEAEVSNELSMSTLEPDKSPSHSSYASPSPSHFVENLGSPMRNGSPHSPRLSNISYMKTAGSASMTIKMDSSLSHFVADDSLTFPLVPPPPPHPDICSTWDFFDTSASKENSGLAKSRRDCGPISCDFGGSNNVKGDGLDNGSEAELKQMKAHPLETKSDLGVSEIDAKANESPVQNGTLLHDSPIHLCSLQNNDSNPSPSSQPIADGYVKFDNVPSFQQCSSKAEKMDSEKISTEREDPSEFITHRAKDFLSSVKDIEHRFSRAAESGNELSRMLEASKIKLNSCLEKIGRPPSQLFTAIHLSCCIRASGSDSETTNNMSKVITWNRSVSSISSSSRLPLTSGIKDDCDSSSDFIEEFCMISGSHSSTLDRLYAWERKLYDEVKASKAIRREYDRKCFQLRHQFARDMNPQVIDKTRAAVKDLHSQVRVAIQAVDSISRRIERLRDEELLPQIIELLQGLIRMWKAMLACHHAQYITMSLAYQVKGSSVAPRGESYRQVLTHLQNKIGCFASSLAMWFDTHEAYVEALNSWLQICILLPQDRQRGRKACFSPRRAIAPPIFVLCRDWSSGIKSLPYGELSDAIKQLLLVLNEFIPVENKRPEPLVKEELNGGEAAFKQDAKNDGISNFSSLQTAMTKMFDRLTKFSEASLKMYEEIKKASETARDAYANGWIRYIT